MKNFRDDSPPEGAISIEDVDRIHLRRFLEEDGESELIPIIDIYALGNALEEQGRFMDAKMLYDESKKRFPKNPWLKEARERVKHTLN